MMPKKLLRAAEVACWCAGCALVAVYVVARADGEIERRAAVSAFLAAAASKQPPAAVRTPPAPLTYGAPDETHWSKGRIRAYAAVPAGGLPVAVLRIRRVGLEVPVFAADTARNMNRGAVLVAGTAAPDTGGNTAIAAHRDGYFRALKDVTVGDAITVRTPARTERFRVSAIEVVEPTDVSVLRPTPVPAVTLVTCYPFYFVGSAPRRYIVRAVAFGGAARKAGAHDSARGLPHGKAPPALERRGTQFETGGPLADRAIRPGPAVEPSYGEASFQGGMPDRTNSGERK